jgi:hypothetical protein
MTPRQADRIIKAGLPVRVRDRYGDEWTATFVRRDRWSIYTETGSYDRGDLVLLEQEAEK